MMRVRLTTCFDLLPKIAPPTLDRYPPDPLITHKQQYFAQKYLFITVAHPIKREQTTNYSHKL